MTKEILKKISVPFTPLDVNDLTPDEKKDLADSFAKRGFTASTFYLRFFQKQKDHPMKKIFCANS